MSDKTSIYGIGKDDRVSDKTSVYSLGKDDRVSDKTAYIAWVKMIGWVIKQAYMA